MASKNCLVLSPTASESPSSVSSGPPVGVAARVGAVGPPPGDNGIKVYGRGGAQIVPPTDAQIEAAARIGAAVVELHTGAYCDLDTEGNHAARDAELAGLAEGARLAASLGLEVHAGHGLTFDTVGPIAALPEVRELNIGHFLIGEAIFLGLDPAIREMRRRMDAARG